MYEINRYESTESAIVIAIFSIKISWTLIIVLVIIITITVLAAIFAKLISGIINFVIITTTVIIDISATNVIVIALIVVKRIKSTAINIIVDRFVNVRVRNIRKNYLNICWGK